MAWMLQAINLFPCVFIIYKGQRSVKSSFTSLSEHLNVQPFKEQPFALSSFTWHLKLSCMFWRPINMPILQTKHNRCQEISSCGIRKLYRHWVVLQADREFIFTERKFSSLYEMSFFPQTTAILKFLAELKISSHGSL